MSSDAKMYLKGANGSVSVFEDRVVIKREGITAKMTQGFFSGDKELMIKDISAIQFREGTNLANGFIKFVIPGEVSHSGGLSDKVKDENAVMIRKGMFDNKVNEQWLELKEMVQGMINKEKEQTSQVNVVQETSSADELAKFADLKEKGIISEEEFEAKKKELLGL